LALVIHLITMIKYYYRDINLLIKIETQITKEYDESMTYCESVYIL